MVELKLTFTIDPDVFVPLDLLENIVKAPTSLALLHRAWTGALATRTPKPATPATVSQVIQESNNWKKTPLSVAFTNQHRRLDT